MKLRLLALVLAGCGGATPAAPPPANAAPVTAAPAPKRASPAEPWIAKLRDPREGERALSQLEQLGDPSAIVPIGEAWDALGRPPRLLAVAISLSRPLTPAEAKAQFLTDYEVTGRPANWSKVVPFLRRAVTELDEANPRSIDSAMKAAEALGEAQQGLDVLAQLAQRPPSKFLIAAQIDAIRALGRFANDKPAAAAALVAIIGRDRPAHVHDERLSFHFATVGAAANSIGQLRTDRAIAPLIQAMYRTPELLMQLRRALVASGPKVAPALRTVLRGEDKAIEAMHIDKTCDDAGSCHPVSARDFYAAVVLGDLHDAAAVPDLLAAWRRPPVPVYYADDQPSPNTQHNAIADALHRIGSPDAAAPMLAVWSGTGDLELRVLAVGVYPFVARDASAAPVLAKLVADPKTDETLRFEAATALGRISRDVKDIAVLGTLAKKYLDASATNDKAANAKRPSATAADRVYEAAKAKAGADKVALRKAKEANVKATAEFRRLDDATQSYLAFARQVQLNIARIEMALRCKDDLGCFAEPLRIGFDNLGSLAPLIPDLDAWPDGYKRDLRVVALERGMLELGKRGAAATAQTAALLVRVFDEERRIRQSILLALPAIAPRPCDACVTALDAVITAGEGKSTLGDLQLETQLFRNYFSWAGRP